MIEAGEGNRRGNKHRWPGLPQEGAPSAKRPRQYKKRSGDEEGIFVGAVEDSGRNQPGKNPARQAAQRHPHVEFGEPCRRWTAAIERAVAEQRQQEESCEI